MSREDDERILLLKKRRRLQKLKEHAARSGINTPPGILTEIEDIEQEIEHIATRLNRSEKIDKVSSWPGDVSSSDKSIAARRINWGKTGTLAGAIGLIVAIFSFVVSPDLRSLISSSVTPTPISIGDFTYQVRVQDKVSGGNISGAVVIVEVGGKAPLDGITDSNGLSRDFAVFLNSFEARMVLTTIYRDVSICKTTIYSVYHPNPTLVI